MSQSDDHETCLSDPPVPRLCFAERVTNENNISRACHRVPRKGYSRGLYYRLDRKRLGQPGLNTRKVMSMSDFARLLQNEIPRLRRYARALTRDAARADDLVQSCLVRAIAKEHLWQPGTDLRAWLFTILHNQNVNEVRRSVREGVAVAVEDVAPMLTVPPRCRRLLTAARSRTGDRLLPEEQRQVILLVGLEGMRYEEVAASSISRSVPFARACRAAVKCCAA